MLIPVGTDANIENRPWVTWVLLAVLVFTTLSIWIKHPAAILLGSRQLCLESQIQLDAKLVAEEYARAEAEFQAQERKRQANPTANADAPASEEGAATEFIPLVTLNTLADKRARDRDPLTGAARDLAKDLGLLGRSREPRTTENLTKARDQIAAAGKQISESDQAELQARLRQCRVVSPTAMILYDQMGGPQYRDVGEGLKQSALLDADASRQRRVITPEEYDWLVDIKHGRETTIASDLAHQEVPLESIPWYIAPYGESSSPLSWLVAPFVHVGWKEAITAIPMFLSLAYAVEGCLGWWRFLLLLLGALLVDGGCNALAGSGLPVVLPRNGMTGVNALLGGFLVVLMPFNRLHYLWVSTRGAGELEWPIWALVLLSFVFGILTRALLGHGVPAVLLVGIALPLAGFLAGTIVLKATRLVDTEEWDLFSWWKTRHLSASERNDIRRQKEIAERRAAFIAQQGQAPDEPETIGGLPAKPAPAEEFDDGIPLPAQEPDPFQTPTVTATKAKVKVKAPAEESIFQEDQEPDADVPSAPAATPTAASEDDLLFSDEAAATLDPDATIVDAAPVEDGQPVDPASDTRHDHSATDTKECHSQLRRALRKGDSFRIYNCYDRLRQADPDWTPPQAMVDRLAKSLYKHEHFLEALRCADDLIAIHPHDAADAHLIAAAVRITQLQDPRRALDHLDQLDLGTLKEARRERAKLLRTDANTMLDAQGDRQLEFA